MDQIRLQVDRARRRLWIELFLGRLVKCWFAALAVAAIAVAVPKIVAIENLPAAWATAWLIGAVAVGLLVALVWTWLRGRSELDAAMEIDRRFDLKERIASSLSLTPEAAATPAGRALVADALRSVGRIEIDERFKIRLGRAAWLPLGPAALALLLVALVDNKTAQSSAAPGDAITAQALDNATTALRERLRERRDEAARRGLEEAEALLAEMEREVERVAAQRDRNPTQALVRLNDLTRELEERRERMGGDEELRRQLAGMRDVGRGPADRMIEAMRSGDWQQAQQELKKLQETLQSGNLDEEARRQLAEQMRQLQEQLAEAAQQRQQAMDDLERKVEEQKRQGNLAEAGELQDQLDRMRRRDQQAQQLQRLAQQMADAQQAMESGNQAAAAQAMQQMMQQLDQMQQDMAEGEMLDMAMEQLEMARDSMTCAECEGEGCAECEGNGRGEGMGDRMSDRPGDGMGEGLGMGDRPEEETDTAFRDSQVKQKPGVGAAVITGEAEGPTVRGDVRDIVTEEMETSGSEPADPLVIEQLPRTQRENAEDFFNRLRDGE
jgi:hypothetical protein